MIYLDSCRLRLFKSGAGDNKDNDGLAFSLLQLLSKVQLYFLSIARFHSVVEKSFPLSIISSKAYYSGSVYLGLFCFILAISNIFTWLLQMKIVHAHFDCCTIETTLYTLCVASVSFLFLIASLLTFDIHNNNCTLEWVKKRPPRLVVSSDDHKQFSSTKTRQYGNTVKGQKTLKRQRLSYFC